MTQALNDTTVLTEDEFNLREELAGIDADIDAAKQEVAIAEAYKRLLDNPDYKLVIQDRFIAGESARVCEMLTMDAHLKPEQAESLSVILGHIRYLKATLKYLIEDGEFAKQNIEKLEDARKEITAGAN